MSSLDKNGRVFIHPLLHRPRNHTEFPAYVTIDQLERDQGFKTIEERIMNEESGSMTIEKKSVIPIQNHVKSAVV